MGLFDGLLGGGAQKTKTELPGYMEDTGKMIGYGVKDVLAPMKGNEVTPGQRDAINRMRDQAYRGSDLADKPTDALRGIFDRSGADPWSRDFGERVMLGQERNSARDEAERIAFGGDLGNNPYLDQTFDRAAKGVRKQFQETISPGLASRASMSGRLGSGAYARLRNNAEQGVGESLSGLANQIYGGAYEADRGRQQQALGLAGQLSQQDTANKFSASNVFDNGLNRQLQAIGLTPQAMDAKYANSQKMLDIANTERDLMFRPYQQANQALSGTPFGQTQVSKAETNPIKELLPLMMGAGMMMCDERLKTDIERVGELPDGAGLYIFRYIWDGPGAMRIGPMAQELRKTNPQAVFLVGGGWLAVDMSKVR